MKRISNWVSNLIRESQITKLLHLKLLVTPLSILCWLLLRMKVQWWVLMLIWALICRIVRPLSWLVESRALCWLNILIMWILRIRDIWKVGGWSIRLWRLRIPSVVGGIRWNISQVELVKIINKRGIARLNMVLIAEDLRLLRRHWNLLGLMSVGARWEINSSRILRSETWVDVRLASWLHLLVLLGDWLEVGVHLRRGWRQVLVLRLICSMSAEYVPIRLARQGWNFLHEIWGLWLRNGV